MIMRPAILGILDIVDVEATRIQTPLLLQIPPTTDAPKQDDPITECGSRPRGASACSSACSVVPGRQMACRPPSIRCSVEIRVVLMMTQPPG